MPTGMTTGMPTDMYVSTDVQDHVRGHPSTVQHEHFDRQPTVGAYGSLRSWPRTRVLNYPRTDVSVDVHNQNFNNVEDLGVLVVLLTCRGRASGRPSASEYGPHSFPVSSPGFGSTEYMWQNDCRSTPDPLQNPRVTTRNGWFPRRRASARHPSRLLPAKP